MSIDLILILGVIVLGFVSLFIFLQRKLTAGGNDEQVENMVHKVFSLSTNKIVEQSKQVLDSEKEAIKVDLENKQRTIENLVKQLQDDMKQRQEEIHKVELNRNKSFGELTSQLEEHRKLTKELETSTTQLAKVLSNNQTRGAWGERIIEDLLSSHGLVEGTHYLRQSFIGNTNLKPDITLLLPNKRQVPVDVKFPYAEIQKMTEADTKAGKEIHVKQFRKDLKIKVTKVAEYIRPDKNTLDYAIMFVPNEMVFSFINQHMPEIVDEALERRVIIVSPFTFLIVAGTVRESYRNFMLEDKLREVVVQVNAFTQEWVKFKDQFEKYGRSIDTLKRAYDDLTSTRFRQMDRRVEEVESFHGQELSDPDQLPLVEADIEE